MSKLIRLTKGIDAMVDDEDFEYLDRWNWYCNRGYACRRERIWSAKGFIVPMHRQICLYPEGMVVDHINGNTLDNRKSNLRICTAHQNTFNSKINKNNHSGFKGIHYCTATGRWRAQIKPGRKSVHLGRFDTPEQAARAYDAAAIKHFGEFARLNFPIAQQALT